MTFAYLKNFQTRKISISLSVSSKFWCDLLPDVHWEGTGQSSRVQGSAKYGR